MFRMKTPTKTWKKKSIDMIGYIYIYIYKLHSDSEYEWDAEAKLTEKLTITDYGCDFCVRLGIVCTTVKICTDCTRTKLGGGNS